MSLMSATMRRAASERPGNQSEFSDDASEISDAMQMVRIAAGPRVVGDSVKAAIVRASRALGWSYTRTRDVWYGDARRIDAGEMDDLRAIKRRHDNAVEVVEREKHIEQVAALRGRLAVRDPEFHRNDIAALDYIVAALRQE